METTLRLRSHMARWSALALLFSAAWLPAPAQSHFFPLNFFKSAPPPEAPGITPDPAKLFAQGQQLTYAIYWGPFEVAHADWCIWTARNAAGENVLRSILNVHTNPSTDLFYRVRASSSTWATPALDHSIQYTTQQDDTYRTRKAELLFDVKKGLVNATMTTTLVPGAPVPNRPPPPGLAGKTAAAPNPGNRGNPRFPPTPPSPWPITEPAYDPLAALLDYGVLPLREKLVQHLCVCDTHGVHDVTVRVIGLEKISVSSGPVYAWVVEPDLPGAGLFLRGSNQPLRLWIATDGTRRLLRFTGSIGIGSFEADLVATAPFTPPVSPKSPVAAPAPSP
jgi:hypothetical protein